jgi:hypothetical protein
MIIIIKIIIFTWTIINGYYPSWIDLFVTFKVMMLNMIHINGIINWKKKKKLIIKLFEFKKFKYRLLLTFWHLINLPSPTKNIRIIMCNCFLVSFKVCMIYGIKPNNNNYYEYVGLLWNFINIEKKKIKKLWIYLTIVVQSLISASVKVFPTRNSFFERIPSNRSNDLKSGSILRLSK